MLWAEQIGGGCSGIGGGIGAHETIRERRRTTIAARPVPNVLSSFSAAIAVNCVVLGDQVEQFLGCGWSSAESAAETDFGGCEHCSGSSCWVEISKSGYFIY